MQQQDEGLARLFLKGCPLRCRWCANPESNLAKPQLMFYAAKCTACGRCVPYCRQGLRRIAGRRMTPEALAKKLLRGRGLMEESGGGVTFSGGEPLMQWPFVRETIERLEGLNCAIETSGYAPEDAPADALVG